MLAIRTEDNKVFKQISTPAFEDRVIADGGTVSSVDNTDKILDAVAAIGVQPSVVMVPSGIKASKLYSQIPYGGGADFTVTRSGTTGMRLNNGYWQPVAADTPRVDLTWNESTQMFEEWLEVEEARTNLISRYKSFAHSDWTKSGASIQGDPNTAGAELVTNGGFDTDTAWTKGVDWKIENGKATCNTTTNYMQMSQIVNFSIGKLYKVNLSVTRRNGYFQIQQGATLISLVTSSGNYQYYYYASLTNTTLLLYGVTSGGVCDIDVDNISIKEVTGYASPFVDANGANLMSGYKLVEGTNTGTHNTGIAVSGMSAGTYTLTVFAKNAGRRYLLISDDNIGGNSQGLFDLQNGVIVSGGATTKTITASADGYYKCSVTYTAGTSAAVRYYLHNGSTPSYLGDGTSGILIAHAQLEAGATASSPIGGAEGSQQTRNADSIVKTGASALIGQTEGVLYAECPIPPNDSLVRMVLSIATDSDNRLEIYFYQGKLRYDNIAGGSTQHSVGYTIAASGNIKLAIGYIQDNVSLYANGTLLNTDTSALIPACSIVNIGRAYNGISYLNGRIKLVHIGKTRLSNAQLQALTTL